MIELQERLAEVFEDGIKKKRFKKITDPYHLAVAIDSFTSAILFGCLEDPRNRSFTQDPDVLLSIFSRGFWIHDFSNPFRVNAPMRRIIYAIPGNRV